MALYLTNMATRNKDISEKLAAGSYVEICADASSHTRQYYVVDHEAQTASWFNDQDVPGKIMRQMQLDDIDIYFPLHDVL